MSLKKSVDEETGLGYIHKPLQQPHPPIAIPGTSPNSPSMRLAGRRGFQPFGHCLIAGNVLADLWKTYEAGALEAGRQPRRADFKVARSIFLADSTAEAKRLARSNSLGKNFEYIGRLCDKGQQAARPGHERAEPPRLPMGEQIIAGSPRVLRGCWG